MAYIFPSDEWINALKSQINASEEYQQSGATWDAGDMCLVINQNPELGLNDKFYLWLDLCQGACRDAKQVPPERGEKARFLISADYDRWKEVLTRQLDPLRGMVMGKIKVRGDLPTLIRHAKAAQDLLDCATHVPTEFLDEKREGRV